MGVSLCLVSTKEDTIKTLKKGGEEIKDSARMEKRKRTKSEKKKKQTSQENPTFPLFFIFLAGFFLLFRPLLFPSCTGGLVVVLPGA